MRVNLSTLQLGTSLRRISWALGVDGAILEVGGGVFLYWCFTLCNCVNLARQIQKGAPQFKYYRWQQTALASAWDRNATANCSLTFSDIGVSIVVPQTLTLSCRTTYIYIYMSYRTANIQMLHFIYYSTNILQNILNMLHTPVFFSSTCRLFHNATFFGSCVIHISYTGFAKIKK